MEYLVVLKGLAVWGWLGSILVLERVVPMARMADADRLADGRFGWRRLARNGALWLINAGLSPIFVLPVSLWAASLDIGWNPVGDAGPWWLALLVHLLILDMFIYWWHRANHEIQFLWRFHEVHHLDHFLDSTSAGRFHAGEVMMSATLRAVVIIAFDIDMATVIVFETILLISAIFQHSNVKLPPKVERALSWVIVTPSIHWIHHHAIRADTDSNYASILSVWDRIFGSRSATRRTPDMPIGVEGRSERSLPGLLARPLDPP